MKSAAFETNGHADRNGSPMNKVKRYNWRPLNDTGRLEWLDKHLIQVDRNAYQREIQVATIAGIAANWNWMACSVIPVVKREDGRYFAYDGQQRTLAARKRDDIQELPCWVFDAVPLAAEARAFDEINSRRKAVKTTDRFRANLVAEDATAAEIATTLERHGYRVAAGGGRGTIACVQEMYRVFRNDPERFDEVVAFCAQLMDGKSITKPIFAVIAYLNTHLHRRINEGVWRADIRDKLMLLGPDGIDKAGRASQAYHGKHGVRVYCDGVIKAINKGRRTRSIPEVM